MAVHKCIAHGRPVLRVARRFGWLPSARYTNLRDVRAFDRIGLLDIDWRAYCFHTHVQAARATTPFLTVARDVLHRRDLPRIIDEALELARFATHVVIVPKDRTLRHDLEHVVPRQFLLGYSVPTRYGGTAIPPTAFRRPVHLLGGRPDRQRQLGAVLPVFSLDCNRFTLDAAFGDYFDGDIFRPHPVGGYERCLKDSFRNINRLWRRYESPRVDGHRQRRASC
jgi:Family of unknown function (DUF6610)